MGCERDLIKAKNAFVLAAKLGLGSSALRTGDFFDESDPQQWHWWGVAAARGHPFRFFDGFAQQVYRFSSDSSLAPVVFMIGRAMRGQISTEKGEIFRIRSYRIDAADRAVSFFLFQCSASRAAVDTWCLIALRLNHLINKDIRKKIGMLIWDARELALHKEQCEKEGEILQSRIKLEKD